MKLRLRLEKALFLGCLLFLPTQLGKHFWPAFSTIYSLPIDYLSPTIYFWDLLLVGLILVWLINSYLDKRSVNKTALNLLAIFLLSQIVSLLTAVNLGAGLVQLYHLLIAGLFGLYLASQSKNIFSKTLVWALSVGVGLSFLIGLGQFLFQHSLNFWIFGERSFDVTTPAIATFDFHGQIFLRPYGTFSHPNVLAGYLVTLLPLLIWLVLTLKLSKVCKWGLVGLIAIMTLLTFSRTALVVLFAEIGWLLKNKLKILVLLGLLILPLVWVRFGALLNFDSLSVIRRQDLAIEALTLFKDHPLNGIGLNNFINQISNSPAISGPSRFLQPAHNIFLLTSAETGLIGLVGLIVLIGFPLFKLWKRRDNLAKSLLVTWGIIIFLGSFDHYFLTLPQGQRLLFLIWGLSMLE